MLKVSLETMMLRAQDFHAYVSRIWDVFHFPVANVANMDESPLSFTGSSKALRSLTVKGIPNVVGPSPISDADNKKSATLLVTAFSRFQKVKPIVLFKGGGQVVLSHNFSTSPAACPSQVSRDERSKWSKDVLVFFNESATVDEAFMLEHYIPTVTRALTPGLLVFDSCNSHLTDSVKKAFLEKGIALAVIPKVSASVSCSY